MTETLAPGPELSELATESRFGSKEHFCEVLLHNDAVILGSLDELREIEEHMNAVELAEVSIFSKISDPKNELDPVFLGEENGRAILGLFKPTDGENPYVKEQYSIDRFDIREVLAYEISEHFGFDLVPPTVHREINGRPGSLQLYLPESHYQTVDYLEKKSGQSHLDFGRNSVDWETIAAFDYIIANTDRHARNVMAKFGYENGQVQIFEDESFGAELIAIDNGTSFSSKAFYGRDIDLKGPVADLTYSLDERSPLALEMGEGLRKILSEGVRRKPEAALERYHGFIEPAELQGIWQRCEDLIKTGVFLSRYNERHVFGY